MKYSIDIEYIDDKVSMKLWYGSIKCETYTTTYATMCDTLEELIEELAYGMNSKLKGVN